jgi:predicted component of type VI protein secretion system
MANLAGQAAVARIETLVKVVQVAAELQDRVITAVSQVLQTQPVVVADILLQPHRVNPEQVVSVVQELIQILMASLPPMPEEAQAAETITLHWALAQLPIEAVAVEVGKIIVLPE